MEWQVLVSVMEKITQKTVDRKYTDFPPVWKTY